MINIWREKCIILAHVNHFHLPFNFQFDHLETDETTNALNNFFYQHLFREGVKKKLLKSGQADRLGGGGGAPPPQPDRFYFVKILTHFVLYKMAK